MGARRHTPPALRLRRQLEHAITAAEPHPVLIERDQYCRVRGCGQRHHPQARHIKHYVHDGLTIVVNLVNR